MACHLYQAFFWNSSPKSPSSPQWTDSGFFAKKLSLVPIKWNLANSSETSPFLQLSIYRLNIPNMKIKKSKIFQNLKLFEYQQDASMKILYHRNLFHLYKIILNASTKLPSVHEYKAYIQWRNFVFRPIFISHISNFTYANIPRPSRKIWTTKYFCYKNSEYKLLEPCLQYVFIYRGNKSPFLMNAWVSNKVRFLAVTVVESLARHTSWMFSDSLPSVFSLESPRQLKLHN